MKITRRLTAAVMVLAVIGTLSVSAFAESGEFGADAVEENKTYTLPEMLTYAIQDEYLANAEYEGIIDAFGAQQPFTNIIKAEESHIAALEPLFSEYGIPLPPDTAGEYTVISATLLDAFRTGAAAETKNIAMYEAFLRQDLPDDVRRVFTSLKSASENHLAAFETNAARLEAGTANAGGYYGRQARGRSRSQG